MVCPRERQSFHGTSSVFIVPSEAKASSSQHLSICVSMKTFVSYGCGVNCFFPLSVSFFRSGGIFSNFG